MKTLKNRTDLIIRESKLRYLNKYEERRQGAATKAYFSAMKTVGGRTASNGCAIMDLYQGCEPQEIAEKAADFYTAITDKFIALLALQGPFVREKNQIECSLPTLEEYQVAGRLRGMK